MTNPFVGLRPFQVTESSLFFGRSRDIAVLENLVLSVPVFVLYAPSGTGKSSLINAGLLPVIEQDPMLLPIIVDPRSDVTQTVRQRLASVDSADGKSRKKGGLAETLERYSAVNNNRVVLILDQFEERLKGGNAPTSLYGEIARLANTRSEAATVIISLREDYLGGLENLMRRVTGLLDASYRVPSLSRLELAEAVHGPLSALGGEVTVDNALVEKVLNDLEREVYTSESIDGRVSSGQMRDRHIEPGYFQIVWSHLWALDGTRPTKRLTQETYQKEGSATGILRSFVIDTLSRLTLFETEALRAALRYMVLPTAAKVAMTIDDLLGLLRPTDFSAEGRKLLSIGGDERRLHAYGEEEPADQLSSTDQDKVKELLASVFHELTQTDAPLFRRVIRSGREEFELVHDLLGLILLQWRGQYKIEASAGVQEVISDLFGKKGSEADNEASRMSTKMAHQILDSASDLLALYGRNLTTLQTPADADANSKNLRTAFGHMATVARDKPKVRPDARLSEAVSEIRGELPSIAESHSSRHIRGIAQAHIYAFTVADKLFLANLILRVRARERVLPALSGILAWVFCQFLAISGLYISYRLILLVWNVPRVQYLAFTLGIIAFLASFLYLFAIYDSFSPSRSWWRRTWVAVRDTLWPREPGGGPLRRPGDLASRGAIVLVWWPIHYVVLEAACFGLAAMFELFGWSPTAGFNLAALISSPVVGIVYGVAAM
jgi:hypothetical protein